MKSVLPKAVRDLTQELTSLPGIGPKSAQRLAIHLLRQPKASVQQFAGTLTNLHDSVHTCSICYNLAEQETCAICQNSNRDASVVCIVEDPLDIEAIEKTETYSGRYHVLGGILSPMEGVGADQLTIHELFTRVDKENITEIIIALDHGMEADATSRHIVTYLQNKEVRITRLARGLPTGGDIEFADALTLSAAFSGRKEVETKRPAL
ncbi:MAG: recombination mediator RecR [Candidatus Andersenbacteria bacterium]